ncbi:hypothetical protein GCM10010094_64890 [Streptomyces flaveus]|uniref:Uncharacterized protein n=1 Tax=Streptomyces flaveus TaxID=66370 RepID=A0A917VM28_9ACTN|nr:hypothetical protein GCM10010094_64890 [Streptomyces flaveus]
MLFRGAGNCATSHDALAAATRPVTPPRGGGLGAQPSVSGRGGPGERNLCLRSLAVLPPLRRRRRVPRRRRHDAGGGAGREQLPYRHPAKLRRNRVTIRSRHGRLLGLREQT